MQEGATPVGSTPAEFQRFVRTEIAKWTKIIQAGGHQARMTRSAHADALRSAAPPRSSCAQGVGCSPARNQTRRVQWDSKSNASRSSWRKRSGKTFPRAVQQTGEARAARHARRDPRGLGAARGRSNCASASRPQPAAAPRVYAAAAPAHDPRTAALLNGIAGRAIELCEGLRLVSGQAAMQVLPGMLAVARARADSERPRPARRASSSATKSPGACAPHSRRGRSRTRTARRRCSRAAGGGRAPARPRRVPESAAPCASRRRWC